jgi:O-methyltransferase
MLTAVKAGAKNLIKGYLKRQGLAIRPIGKSYKRIDITTIEGFKELSAKVENDGRTLLEPSRRYILWQAVKNCAVYNLPVAEVGVFMGGSAYFLCSILKYLNNKNKVYLFDTFEGHVIVDESIDGEHKVGRFSHRVHPEYSKASYESVCEYLKEFDNKVIYKGNFLETCNKVSDLHFGFVHIDVDVYPVTKGCLEFFSKRLVKGGVMVMDDYGSTDTKGVKKAVDEFVSANSPNYLSFHLENGQALLIKV